MKIKNKLVLTFLILLTSLVLTGCQDQKAYNNEFTVIFYTGISTSDIVSTSIDPLIDIQPGSLITKPEDPTAAGAQFVGWYKEQEHINEWDFESDTISGSTVIYSKWEMSDLTINYLFDEAGGNLIDEPVNSYTVLQSIILPKADRLGSLFLGWILTPVDEYKVGDIILKETAGYSTNLDLYALFENKDYTIRFRSLLTDVSNPKTYVVEFASIMDFPVLDDTSTKTFLGWFSLDGTETDEWGFQYENGDLFLGKALTYDAINDEWEFLPQGITIYAQWADK